MNKYKILNDPVHGFISIPNNIAFELIEHPYFQRLRRITQMGMAHYVYPGAIHTRFHHALGAMHLMQKAISVLRTKGIEVTKEEEEGALVAILLHDIGHGPYSHALEYVMTADINHEFFSELIMQSLNERFEGRLSTALSIFQGNYPKPFLHQLVSSQLDVDRLDYLARDSFFSGVHEGHLSTERIISMLNVVDNNLVVEEKGLYSIEKYIISRRLMYWQVYLHKTAVCAESILVAIVKRAKALALQGHHLPCSEALGHFLNSNITKADFAIDPLHIQQYCQLDDYDVMGAIKQWMRNKDALLAYLCRCLVERKLFKVRIHKKPVTEAKWEQKKATIINEMGVTASDVDYLLFSGPLSNVAYKAGVDGIKILTKKGKVKDFIEVSDQFTKSNLAKTVEKYYLCYPKVFSEISR
ncbi:MAG: HD domain-containing protein [Saprospiraceae bacterium]|nr:HD domain-containing protein [Saprospiraceae bacterium]